MEHMHVFLPRVTRVHFQSEDKGWQKFPLGTIEDSTLPNYCSPTRKNGMFELFLKIKLCQKRHDVYFIELCILLDIYLQ